MIGQQKKGEKIKVSRNSNFHVTRGIINSLFYLICGVYLFKDISCFYVTKIIQKHKIKDVRNEFSATYCRPPNALYIIELRPCISNKEKGNNSFFLIRYETALDRKIYTIMLLRPKDDKRAIPLIYLYGYRKLNINVWEKLIML